MCNAKIWLTKLEAQRNDLDSNDFEWFRRNADAIYTTLQSCLSRSRMSKGALRPTTRLLILLRDYLPSEIDLKRWIVLLDQAIAHVENDDSMLDIHANLLAVQGMVYMTFNQPAKARECYTRIQEMGDSSPLLRQQQVEAITGLLMLEAHTSPPTATSEMAGDILGYNAPFRSPDQSMRLYQALAYASNYWGNREITLNYGGIAYNYWEERDNHVEMGRSAYAMAIAFRRAKQYADADHWLMNAADSFSRTNYIWQYINIHYELGCLFMLSEDYEDSEQWMRLAVEDCMLLNDTRRLMGTSHGLALAIIYNDGPKDEAVKYARMSIQLAHKLPSPSDFAHLHHTWGHLMYKYGDTKRALRWLYRGRRLYDTLPTSDFARYITERIDALIEEIEGGNGNPDDLHPYD